MLRRPVEIAIKAVVQALLIADILVRELGGLDRQIIDSKPDTDTE